MNIMIIVRMNVAMPIFVELDFDLVALVQWIQDRNGMRWRFAQIALTPTIGAPGSIRPIVFPLRIHDDLK